MLSKFHFLNLRQKYLPQKIRLIFLLESPPASGDYFYDSSGRTTEQLFSAMMKLIDCNPSTKDEGLAEFANRGRVLVDATYSPVNKINSQIRRNKIIMRDLPNLIDDLRTLTGTRQAEIILVKANICRMLEGPLKANGFKVLNRGIVAPFPGSGQQKNFFAAISKILPD